MDELLSENMPWAFWQVLLEAVSAGEWRTACRQAMGALAGLPAAKAADLPGVLAATLGEGQFGASHWRLSRSKRLYYRLRPLLPPAARPLVQRLAAHRQGSGSLLRWPVEERYVRFQFEALRQLLLGRGLSTARYVHFWPGGRRLALVLTHDVESADGQGFAGEVAALEEDMGFRSSFNLVPEGYRRDERLAASLRERGFEVGVHGLVHDGRLCSSPRVFGARARRINGYLHGWQAAGFRAPMTNRHPQWLQALDVEYDASFFDTDPFEPIAGGTMSIWPFTMGRFVELPYTLAQDHTLTRTLGETTPRLWLDKLDFLRRHCGMALVNTHPDYLRDPACLAVYEQFLAEVRHQGDYWQALPAAVGRWWRRRAEAGLAATADGLRAGVGRASLGAAGEVLHLEAEVG